VYDAGVIDIPAYMNLVGMSSATPISAACIALGIYSQPGEHNAEHYNPGWQLVRDTVCLCNEWPVVNSPARNMQGDVETLTHCGIDKRSNLKISTFRYTPQQNKRTNIG